MVLAMAVTILAITTTSRLIVMHWLLALFLALLATPAAAQQSLEPQHYLDRDRVQDILQARFMSTRSSTTLADLLRAARPRRALRRRSPTHPKPSNVDCAIKGSWHSSQRAIVLLLTCPRPRKGLGDLSE